MISLTNLIVITLCFASIRAEAVLAGYPLTFSMNGITSYTPDAGGSLQTGYLLTLSYVGKSWLAVQFAQTGVKTDFLVLQISDFYSNNGNPLFNGHQVTYRDYYKTLGGLNMDTITTYDISAYSYSNTKSYSLSITRYKGSNNGQDWNANTKSYSILKTCFYTSDQTFDPNAYTNGQSACYNYQINNLVSTFVGPFLKSFLLNGFNTSIYGFIDGPMVKNKVYIYQQTPLFSYVKVPAVALEIGTTGGGFGQDFYVASPISNQNGDYYGLDVNNLHLDNLQAGYQNPALLINAWNAGPANQISGLGTTSLRISFARQVYTHDKYDKTMLSTFMFCMYLYSTGSIQGALSDRACQIVQLSPSYIQLQVNAKSWQMLLTFVPLLILISII